MKTIQGVVAMLGYTRVSRKTVTYSVIEVGDHAILDVAVPKPLIKYLSKAARSAETSALYIRDNRLIGLQVGKGTALYHRTSFLLVAVCWIFSIILIPVLGLGLFLLWHSIRYLGYAKAGAVLARQGATRIN